MTTQPLNVYDRARIVLDDRGWTQADLTGPGGTVDIFGALLLADGIVPDDVRARGNLIDDHLERYGAFLAPLLPERRGDTDVEAVSLWNDESHRTQAEVDRLLEIAGDQLRLAEQLTAGRLAVPA